MSVCPHCGGRATKRYSLTTGLLHCQQCEKDYAPSGSLVAGAGSWEAMSQERLIEARDHARQYLKAHELTGQQGTRGCELAETLVQTIGELLASRAVVREAVEAEEAYLRVPHVQPHPKKVEAWHRRAAAEAALHAHAVKTGGK